MSEVPVTVKGNAEGGAHRPASVRRPGESLSAQLLLLTVAFVLMVEALVLLPNLATFRENWLEERHDAADVAILALQSVPADDVTPALRATLLQAVRAQAVVLNVNGRESVVLGTPPDAATARNMPAVVLDDRLGRSLRDTLESLSRHSAGLLTVTAPSRLQAGSRVSVILNEAPLRTAMMGHAVRLLGFSLILAILTGGLVFAALGASFVAPLGRLTAAIERFRNNPQDGAHRFRPSGRRDEIGRAEEALADMEEALRTSFSQRERLAALGEAVSRIAHDLRNSLAAAQMVSDRLATSSDPLVRASTPRLERALERAIGLAESTLRYGKAEEADPVPQSVALREALDDAADEALAPFPAVAWQNAIPEGLSASVDPDHLHRISSNLIRNAAQAIVQSGHSTGDIRVEAPVSTRGVTISLIDTGPGIPERARRSLFIPFSSGDRSGTGLGLAIARDLARRNGGDVTLATTGPDGTRIDVSLRSLDPSH